MAADESFDGSRPHLVMVEPQSLLIVELSCQDHLFCPFRQELSELVSKRTRHRDALTWGVTLLECAKGGVNIFLLV